MSPFIFSSHPQSISPAGSSSSFTRLHRSSSLIHTLHSNLSSSSHQLPSSSAHLTLRSRSPSNLLCSYQNSSNPNHFHPPSHHLKPCSSFTRLSTVHSHLPRSYLPAQSLISWRSFQTSSPRKDLLGFGVLSCSIPIFKSFLLSLTRATLVVLPFWYRWKLARYFPKASRTLLTIPLFAMCLVVAIGIDQSPRTHRWRLLLMSESEEMEWSHRRFEDLLEAEGHLILGPTDPRTKMVKRVCDRLITALDLDSPVSAATWPKADSNLKDRLRRMEARKIIRQSATSGSSLMPWKPESNNPEKVLDCHDWHLFIIDLPRVNAFVLPTKEIFVYTGLLELIKNDEELTAAIIAHEVSHVVERHTVENMGFSALSTVVFDAMRGISFALTMSFPMISDGLASVINYLNDVVVEKAYSRKLETEADELGLMIMARAEYNPQAALALWKFFNLMEEEQQEHNHSGSILAGSLGCSDRMPWTHTHPTSKDRELAIQKALPKALEIFQKPSGSA